MKNKTCNHELYDMDIETLIRLSNITKGKLYHRREEIRKSFVLYSLSDLPEEESFKVGDLSKKLYEMAKINMDDEIITSVLLNEKEYFYHIKGDEYKLKKDIRLPEFKSVLKPIWNEFESYLKKKYMEYDPYIDKDAEKILHKILCKLITKFSVSSDQLENQLDSLPYDDFKSSITDLIITSTLSDKLKKQLPDIVCSFFDQKTPNFLDFIYNSYTSIINIDLMKTGMKIPSLNLLENIKFLLLDSNVIVSLLCTTHPNHSLALAVAKKCNEANIPLYYTEKTKIEISNIIYSAKMEMKGFTPESNHSTIRTPFVEDFSDLEKTISWNDYLEILQCWEQKLEKYNIVNLPEEYDIDIQRTVYDYIMTALEILDNNRHNRRKEKNIGYIPEKKTYGQRDHDAACISLIAANRKKMKKNNDTIGPWFLTFDNLIALLENNQASNENRRSYVIQPRAVLNYILTFSKINYKKQDELDVAQAIIEYTTKPDDQTITIKKYANLITNKMNLDVEDRDIIEKIFISSPLNKALEKALHQDRGGEADKISLDIITDEKFVESIINKKEDQRKIKKLSKRVQEEIIKRREIEKIMNNTNISVDLNIDIDVKIKSKIEGIISILQGEKIFKKGILEEPDNSVLHNTTKLKSWLIKIKETIKTSEEISDSIKCLLPLITQIISTL